jgi:dTDP-4-dehydrorhamnose reductase
MLILLFGKNGQVGWELQQTLAPLGQVVALGRGELDLQDFDGLRQGVRRNKPVLIVNAAAYTDVNRAESEPEQAMNVNGIAPGILAEEAKRLGAIFVHYSTDYVFDGQTNSPYTEQDKPAPLNTYGRTKLAGEQAVQAADGAYLILRTSWVYGLRGRNFLCTILSRAREKDKLQVVNDQTGSPTWCRSVADATASILFKLLQTDDRYEKARSLAGVYHYAASGYTTWFGFAKAILETDPQKNPSISPMLLPISSDTYPSPARRPRYSVLSTDKIKDRFGILPSHWRDQLRSSWLKDR